jgi:hypothetical protein
MMESVASKADGYADIQEVSGINDPPVLICN